MSEVNNNKDLGLRETAKTHIVSMLNGRRVQVKGSNLILLREIVAFLTLILDISQSERNDPSSLEDWHLTYLTFYQLLVEAFKVHHIASELLSNLQTYAKISTD